MYTISTASGNRGQKKIWSESTKRETNPGEAVDSQKTPVAAKAGGCVSYEVPSDRENWRNQPIPLNAFRRFCPRL
jgi:hypothetical protein